MKSKNNSDPYVCAEHLLKTERGEVPGDILRGLPGELIDRAENRAKPTLNRAVRFCIENYEPRIQVYEIIG